MHTFTTPHRQTHLHALSHTRSHTSAPPNSQPLKALLLWLLSTPRISVWPPGHPSTGSGGGEPPCRGTYLRSQWKSGVQPTAPQHSPRTARPSAASGEAVGGCPAPVAAPIQSSPRPSGPLEAWTVAKARIRGRGVGAAVSGPGKGAGHAGADALPKVAAEAPEMPEALPTPPGLGQFCLGGGVPA